MSDTITVPANSIVLNPDSGVVWEFLNKHGSADRVTCTKGFALAQEIRKQMRPDRIDEPGWGVVVEAGVKGPGPLGRLRWLRESGAHARHWNCEVAGVHNREWDELIDPKVVTPETVTEEP